MGCLYRNHGPTGEEMARSTSAFRPMRQRKQKQGKISPWCGGGDDYRIPATVNDEVGRLRWIGSSSGLGTHLRRIKAEGFTGQGFSTEAGSRSVGNGCEEGRLVVVGDG
jgi:hypothetical protein